MKKLAVISVLLVAFSFGTASAQTGTSPDIYVSWGMNMPLAPTEFNDFWNPSWFNLGFGVGTDITSSLSIIGFADYHRFGFDSEEYTKSFGNAGLGANPERARIAVASVSANLKFTIPVISEKLNVYFLGGGGIMRLMPADLDFSPTGANTMQSDSWVAIGEKENAAMVNGAFGLEFTQVSGSDVTFEVRYMYGFSGVATSFLPIKVGFRFKI